MTALVLSSGATWLLILILAVGCIFLAAWWAGDLANDPELTSRRFDVHERERRLRQWRGEDPNGVWIDVPLETRRGPYDWEHDEAAGL